MNDRQKGVGVSVRRLKKKIGQQEREGKGRDGSYTEFGDEIYTGNTAPTSSSQNLITSATYKVVRADYQP